MKYTDLKHLTLKTAFLLALASGKRRSEIHAWVANKASNLGQWEKVALFPSSVYLGFYVAFNTVQVISRRVVGRAEETST